MRTFEYYKRVSASAKIKPSHWFYVERDGTHFHRYEGPKEVRAALLARRGRPQGAHLAFRA